MYIMFLETIAFERLSLGFGTLFTQPPYSGLLFQLFVFLLFSTCIYDVNLHNIAQSKKKNLQPR